MENTDKGLIVPKWVLIAEPKIHQMLVSAPVNDQKYVFYFRPKPKPKPEKHLALGWIPKPKPKVQIYVKIGGILLKLNPRSYSARPAYCKTSWNLLET